MTVRCHLFAVLAALVLCGCSGRDSAAPVPEPDESAFREGQQKLREGRAPEALTWFLKVIDKRGVQNSPESHLEAGRIYLQYIKDPVEAYHYFRKYLELQPNSTQADLVRGKVDESLRLFATRLPLRPEDNQVKFEAAEEIERLKRDNAELRAQLQTLQGGNAAPVTRAAKPTPANTVTAPSLPIVPVDASPLTAPPPRPTTTTSQPTRSAAATPSRPTAAPTKQTPPPLAKQAPPPPAKQAAAGSGRTHTVGQGESAWAIARRYYGATPTALQVQALLDANHITGADLKPGMTLRIP